MYLFADATLHVISFEHFSKLSVSYFMMFTTLDNLMYIYSHAGFYVETIKMQAFSKTTF